MARHAELARDPQPPSAQIPERSATAMDPIGIKLNARPAVVAQRALAEQLSTTRGAPNRTGLPDKLKTGVEALSGISLDDVRVHRNSAAPAQMQAHAFAQGSDIHLAPGQEQHLPHEAWHVVQQKQGRVQATRQMKGGVAINDDDALEAEADAMGARAAAIGPDAMSGLPAPTASSAGAGTIQRLAKRMTPPKGWEEANNLGRNIAWTRAAEKFEAMMELGRESLSSDYEEVQTEDEKENIDQIWARLDRLEHDSEQQVATGNAIFAKCRSGYDNKHDDALFEIRKNISTGTAELEQMFKASHGFSAVARAANVAVTVNPEAGGAHYFKNTKVDNKQWNPGVVKDAAAVAAIPKGVMRIENKPVNPLLPPPIWLDQMTPPEGVGRYFTSVAAKPRGGTQDQAMKGTSARAYAWISNTPGWNTERWEWLHIRGASLGGSTGPENLVLGTRDSNTHMMPFENNLIELIKIARATSSAFTGMHVRWSIGSSDAWPHKVDSITISWDLTFRPAGSQAPVPTAGSYSSEVTFSPLAAGNVLSKTEVEIMQAELKAARDRHAQPEVQEPASSSVRSGSPLPRNNNLRNDDNEDMPQSLADPVEEKQGYMQPASSTGRSRKKGASSREQEKERSRSKSRRRPKDRTRSRSRSRSDAYIRDEPSDKPSKKLMRPEGAKKPDSSSSSSSSGF